MSDNDKRDEDDENDEEFLLLAAAKQWATTTSTKDDDGDVAPLVHSNKNEEKKSKKKDKNQRKKAKKQSATCDVDTNEIDNHVNNNYHYSCTSDEHQQEQLQNSDNQKHSLHITNLPYSASKEDIIKIFTSRGCKVTSTRLVFGYHKKTNYGNDGRRQTTPPNNGFTGVAFVDLLDEMSYKKGLELDKLTWSKATFTTSTSSGNDDGNDGGGWRGRGRKLNVRPTRTKQELADIVKRTQEKVAFQKQKYHEQQQLNQNKEVRGDQNQQNVKSHNGQDEHLKTSKRKHCDTVDEDKFKGLPPDTGNSSDNSPRKKKRNKRKSKHEKEDRKLTKKERAKKAAIIISKKKS